MAPSNSASPLVSVCIPTCNRSDRLGRSLGKLLECTYRNLEIIISDNASSDRTQTICTELCIQDKRVRYFRHTQNRGITRNFEFARAQATGKYFLWHSDDDYLEPDFIRLCVDALEKDSSLILVSGLSAFHRGDYGFSHYGDGFQLQSPMHWLRVLKFIFRVHDGSIFYGLYRRQEVMHCQLPNCLGGDHIWLMEVLLEGKGRIIFSSFIHRELGESASSSMDHLVATLGVASWHARYPWIALSFNLANHLAFHSSKYRNRWMPVKLGVWFLVLVIALLKQFSVLAILTLPYGQWLYRRLFISKR